MAAHLKLVRQKPLDVWTVRERLLLASAVLQSGDQNWVSVSRAIKNQSVDSRPSEYFSQKNCALQYGELLENAETPKRKRSEKNEVIPVETQGFQIVNKLKLEYMEMLVKDIKKQQEDYAKLSDEIEMVDSGHCDEQLTEIWDQIQRKQNVKQEQDTSVSLSLSETSIENEQTLSSLTTSIPDPDDTSTQDSQEADIEVDDHIEDVPSFSEEIVSTPSLPLNTLSVTQESESKPETALEASCDSIESSSVEKVETVDTVEETTLNLVDDTVTEATTDIVSEDTADTSNSLAETAPLVDTPTASESATEAASELVAEEEPSVEDTVTELVQTETKSRHKSRTSRSSRRSSEASTHEDISVEDEVMPKPTKVPSPVRLFSSDKPASQLTISVVPAEIDRSISPESTVSSVSDLKTKEAATPSGSGANRRRSSRVTKQKDDKKEDQSTSATKTGSETELISDDDEKPVNSSRIADATPLSPSISQQSEGEEDKYHKAWKKTIMMVWRVISHHKFANVFMHQVTDDIAPGYSTCVHRPISLTTIKQNVEKNVIRTTDEFTRDMMLMFVNAMMYNNHEYDVYAMAQEMYDETMKTIEQHTQNTGKEVDSKSSALRGRRSEASTSLDKDVDKSRRRSSADQNPESGLPPTKKRKTRADD